MDIDTNESQFRDEQTKKLNLLKNNPAFKATEENKLIQ